MCLLLFIKFASYICWSCTTSVFVASLSLMCHEANKLNSSFQLPCIYTGLIERADLVRRARELKLSDSRLYPSISPSLPSIVRERGEGGAGVADVDDSLHVTFNCCEVV